MTLADQFGQAFQWCDALEQVQRWRIVEQGAWLHVAPFGNQPAQRQQRHQGGARAQHAQRVGPVDLLGVDVFPDLDNAAHAGVKIIGTAGQCAGVDGAGRGSGDDGKGVGLVQRATGFADIGNRLQNTDLIGGTRTATTEDQSGNVGGRAIIGHENIIHCGPVGERLFARLQAFRSNQWQ